MPRIALSLVVALCYPEYQIRPSCSGLADLRVENTVRDILRTMGSRRGDDKILSYEDAILRKSDLDILRGPQYINDRIIEFYFSYLSNTYPSSDVLLVPPSISFWIANCSDSDSVQDVVKPMDFLSREIIIFPVNDNDDVTMAGGGTHWSLLVYDREKDVFVHHDSASLNCRVADKLFSTIKGLMGSLGSPSVADHVVKGPTPKQENGYDCGLFVMAIAKAICQWHASEANNPGNWFDTVIEVVTLSSVGGLRKEVLKLVKSLMEQKKQKEKEQDS